MGGGSGKQLEGVPTVAPVIVHEVLAGPGAPLPAAARVLATQRFGIDADTIRVHTDARAAASARAVRARAYTVGRHLVFADGAFAPDSSDGIRLLQHELQHASEQGDAPIPGVGGLRVAGEVGLERSAEAAEHGGASRACASLGPVLQRKAEARATATAIAEVGLGVREALRLDSPSLALQRLRELAPGAGAELARRDPTLRALVARSLPGASYFRVEMLAILAGAADDARHVAVARKLFDGRIRAAVELVKEGSSRAVQAVEAAFDRDLHDVFPGRPTLVRCLRGAGEAGLQFERTGEFIVDFEVPLLRAWMLLDHEPADVEAEGLALAAGSHEQALAGVRRASGHGRTPRGLRDYGDRWQQLVVETGGWQRPALWLTKRWCTVDLETALRSRLPEGPRLQVQAYFDELHARQAAISALRAFRALVAELGREGALRRVAEELRAGLVRAREDAAILGDSGPVTARFEQVFTRLRYWEAGDLRELATTYARLGGATLPADLRRHGARNDALFALLGLLATGTSYGDHVRLAQAVFRGEVGEAQRVLYHAEDAARDALREDYHAAFAGLLADDDVATAYRHVRAEFDGKARWELEKTQVLLDARPTAAEELYFSTEAIRFPNSTAARNIVKDARGRGRAGFRALNDSWEARVRGERSWLGGLPLSNHTMRVALDRLSGDDREYVDTIYREYGDALTGAVATGPSVTDLAPALDLLDRAVHRGDTARIKEEAQHVGGLVRALRAADGGPARTRALDEADARVRRSLAGRGRRDDAARKATIGLYASGAVSDADELYRQFQLTSPYASNELAVTAALTIVTRRWAANTLEALAREAATPSLDPRTGEVLRPAFKLSDLFVGDLVNNGREVNIFGRIQFMLYSDLGRLETASRRVYLELWAPKTGTAERLGGALAFLGELSAAELPAVLAIFAEQYGAGRPGPPAEVFIDYLVDDFGLAKEVPKIADRVRGEVSSVDDALTRGRLAEASRHTGFFSEVAAFLGAALAGQDRRPAIQQSLRNLEAIAIDAQVQPEQLARNATRAGKRSGAELAAREYAALTSYLDDENGFKAEAAKWVGFTIEVVVRAALVTAFGPTGLAGALIGVGTVGTGRLATEALLGANNDLLSGQNAADLLGEVTGPIFEAIKLEDRIGRFVDAFTRSPFASRVFTSAGTKLATGAIDGAIERYIRQNGAIDVDKAIGNVVGALVEGLGKVVADKITINTTTFSSRNERWLTTVAKQLFAGAPPKSSLLASGVSQIVKVIQDYHLRGRDAFDVDDLKKRFYDFIITTLLTGATIGTANAVVKGREASRQAAVARADPEALRQLAEVHPLIGRLIRGLPPEEQRAAVQRYAEDPNFGRARIGRPSDPAAPERRFVGRTLRAELDGLVKAIREGGTVDARLLDKVRNSGQLTAAERRAVDLAVAARERQARAISDGLAGPVDPTRIRERRPEPRRRPLDADDR